MKPCDAFCLLIFMAILSGTSGASLTASPSQITIGGSNQTSQLTVSCSPNVPGITQVSYIEIGQISSTGSKQAIIEIGTPVTVVDTSLQQRMTASGSINGATGSLQFTLTDLRCADAASTYYCWAFYFAGTRGTDVAATNITARKNKLDILTITETWLRTGVSDHISVSAYPEQLEMLTQYDCGQLISFRCAGKIGNVFDENNLQNLWTWEWRSKDNDTSWTRYPNDQNITYDRPTSSADCQYTGASTLTHTVSNLDNGTQFRCSVLTSDYSANKTVYVNATCVQENQESSLGVGVALGVCVVLVVGAICLSLAYVLRNKQANCISVEKNTRNAEMSVLSNIRAPATVVAPVGIQTPGVGDEYEVPVDRSHYDALQRDTADVPNIYEKIRTYQNV